MIKETSPLRKRLVSPLALLFSGVLVIGINILPFEASGATADTDSANKRTPTAVDVLDTRRIFALGMVETGNNDREVGKAGEVSRFQIHPVVWKAYSASKDYTNLDVSLEVAKRHWTALARYFRDKTGREPEDFDMYVLWNTKQGYYSRRGFLPHRLSAVVRDRAQRFVNLVNR